MLTGCGLVESGISYPQLFDPCAPSEWEAVLTDTTYTMGNPTELLLPLALPLPNNPLGCSPHSPGYFDGKVAFVRRGSCTFDSKTVNAEDAGATAILIYNDDRDIPGLMALTGTSRKPNIPGWIISKEMGEALASRLQADEALTVFCQWKPVK
ncbi:unnamed protein product, partial [Polarella glacialis]